jgi:hypothetical protein
MTDSTTTRLPRKVYKVNSSNHSLIMELVHKLESAGFRHKDSSLEHFESWLRNRSGIP